MENPVTFPSLLRKVLHYRLKPNYMKLASAIHSLLYAFETCDPVTDD